MPNRSRHVPRGAAAALALGLLAGCGLPGGGGGPGGTTLSVSIDWGGSPDCVPASSGSWDFASCSDDGTVVVTNTGANPTVGGVLVSATGTQFSPGEGTTAASITSSGCSAVLQPAQSCTAQIHAEVHDLDHNGVTGVVNAFALNASASHEFNHTTG